VKDNKLETNLHDEIARGAIVTNNGELLWPNPNPPKLDAVKAHKVEETVKVEAPTDLFP